MCSKNTDDVSISFESDSDLETTPDASGATRNEVEEIHNVQRKDTVRVSTLRVVLTLALLGTGLLISWNTYDSLVREENSKFTEAFEQFSRTVADAAVAKQENIRHGLRSFANSVTSAASAANATWPFFLMPDIEVHWKDMLGATGMEVASIGNVVTQGNREAYESWVGQGYEQWMFEAHTYAHGNLDKLDPVNYIPFIATLDGEGQIIPQRSKDVYVPVLSFSPPPFQYVMLNADFATAPHYAAGTEALFKLRDEMTYTIVAPPSSIGYALSKEDHDAMHSSNVNSEPDFPHSSVMAPVHERLNDPTSPIVAIIVGVMAWDAAWRHLLPGGVVGITAVLENTCGQVYTYEIEGPDALYKGEGDLHERAYDSYKVVQDLSLHRYGHPIPPSLGHCLYSMSIYPSDKFKSLYTSNAPMKSTVSIAIAFTVVIFIFVIYDMLVRRRNENLVMKAAQSNAVVADLFPGAIRDKMLDQRNGRISTRNKMKSFLHDGKVAGDSENSKPLAELYLDTTVLFADVSGFTAWSSVREPTQVFTLLENIYQSFDEIAKRRKVFKVETVGDCYVAVCGLPEPKADHAVVMARFARDILSRMATKTKELEVVLGPDTGDLQLRIGLHSGPVTAGVLRGERARFQLFGDTVNVCARIESTGLADHIHCSQETAALLRKAGKDSWLEMREDYVSAKGKGLLKTYFIKMHRHPQSQSIGSSGEVAPEEDMRASATYGERVRGLSEKTYRLIDWNVEMLLQLMKEVVARRSSTKAAAPGGRILKRKGSNTSLCSSLSDLDIHDTPLEEVREIITLPEFDSRVQQVDPATVKIPPAVTRELHHLVSTIAQLYNDNPFHNFEHASHVVMSVIKLMSRIVAPSDADQLDTAAKLHDHTYGITSDPLTQFACAFSALIHDVDHVGVSNDQLVKEAVPIAAKYNGRSVAEQNSLDLSWELLMKDDFENLRSYLFRSESDLVRFRQLVVNSVMATDIADKELKDLRNARWTKAFASTGKEENGVGAHKGKEVQDARNRKATIVIEHIIQASDISHTMQHWHVYRKWNQNLFEELYVAYLKGRMERDPAEFWYKGEFGFFDFYIIPLTQKLKDCGVFGVSSGEYLDYARKNRAEWEARGEEVVAEMIQHARKKYGVKSKSSPAHVVSIDC